MMNTIKIPGRKGSKSLATVLWVVVTLMWPLLRWVLAFDVAWHAVKAVFGSGEFGGIVFLAHFTAFCALTYFVAYYRPKGTR